MADKEAPLDVHLHETSSCGGLLRLWPRECFLSVSKVCSCFISVQNDCFCLAPVTPELD